MEGEGISEKNIRMSNITRTKSVRLIDYEGFPDQAIDAECDLIEEAMMVESEPINLNQLMDDSNWLATMQEDLRAIERNKTRELIDISSKKPTDMKWIYKLKLRKNGEISKYKAKLVPKDFIQKAYTDFNEVYAPIARLETIRIVMATPTYQEWKMH
ncbi:uncharacterized mitochondrial protein AtMg00820-like [Lathyrus oleraceus]|uniref:uncharacterized mitochondrial protein AtMg00820-like n=1 Tax=Pisum sativum TaxID=3888 RepID=UPI0021D12524|nr:uncharacterized mitochondrial protein AtMg00820-like [Pisum sativum]